MPEDISLQLTLLLVAAAIGLLVLANYRAGVVLLIVLLPFSASQLVPRQMFGVTGLNPFNCLLLLSVLSFLLYRARRGLSVVFPSFPPLLWAYVLPFLIAGAIGVGHVGSISTFLLDRLYQDGDIVSVSTRGGYLLAMVIKPLIIVAAIYFLSMTIAMAKKPERVLVPVFASASLFALVITAYVMVMGIELQVLSQATSRGALSWVGMHANEQGLLLNLAFALTLYTFASARRGSVRVLLFVVLALITAGVMLTFSRGAYLGYLVVISYFVITRQGSRKLFAIAAFSIATIALVPDELIVRITHGLGEWDMEAISAGRVNDIWIPLLPHLLDSPVYGRGLGAIMWSPPMLSGSMLPVGHPHSAYLGAALDMGFLGAALIGYFWYRVWKLFRTLGNQLRSEVWGGFFDGASVGVLVLLVQGLTDDRFTPTYSQAFLWLALGFGLGFSHRLKRAHKEDRVIRQQRVHFA